MLKRKNKSVGIDFGSHFIKVVSLAYDEKGVSLDKFFIQKTPQLLIESGVIHQPEQLGEILKTLLNEHKIFAKNISTSISLGEENAWIRWVSIPNVKEKDMEKVVSSLLEEEFRHSSDQLYYNWTKISESKEDGKDIAYVMIVAVLKDSVDKMVSTLRTAKLKPNYSEPTLLSTLRMLYPNGKNNKKTNVGVVDLGSKESIVGFIKNGELAYTRTLQLGGEEFITRIMNVQGMDFRTAEKNLLEYGYIGKRFDHLPLERQVVCDTIKDPMEMILEDVKTTLDFYQERYDSKVDKIIFVGGGARIENFSSFATDFLGTPCEIGGLDNLERLELHKNVDFLNALPTLSVALGLALKEVEDLV